MITSDEDDAAPNDSGVMFTSASDEDDAAPDDSGVMLTSDEDHAAPDDSGVMVSTDEEDQLAALPQAGTVKTLPPTRTDYR
jgi:hypothetical protein